MSSKKKQIRQNFRDSVFLRDGYKCVFCDITEELDAHHITDRNDMPNGGYVRENGISLCPHHHLLAEEYHTTLGTCWKDGFHPSDLYLKINSNKELATLKSKLLT